MFVWGISEIMYIYHISVLIEEDEDLQLENKLWATVEQALAQQKAELVSSRTEELNGQNFGRCIKCGAWTSDWTKSVGVKSLSNGAQIDGEWFCDECLPLNHPNHF